MFRKYTGANRTSVRIVKIIPFSILTPFQLIKYEIAYLSFDKSWISDFPPVNPNGK